MTVITRLECPEHGIANVIGRRCAAWASPYVFCTHELAEVEYVPASRLAGAVDLLEQAVSLIAQPTIPGHARKRWQAAVDELLGDRTTAGGQ